MHMSTWTYRLRLETQTDWRLADLHYTWTNISISENRDEDDRILRFARRGGSSRHSHGISISEIQSAISAPQVMDHLLKEKRRPKAPHESLSL